MTTIETLFALRDTLIEKAEAVQSEAAALVSHARNEKQKFDAAHAIGRTKGLLDACSEISKAIEAAK